MVMTFAIEVMKEEHQYILRMLKVGRAMCQKILDGKPVNTEDFSKLIDFVRNYADKFHHGKEEAILFKVMEEDIGKMAAEGPIRGMLVEHDFGRLFMSRLEEALKKYDKGEKDMGLDIIASTISYTHLLNHHIHTEDTTLFAFAEKQLKKEALEQVNTEVRMFEEDINNIKVKEKYIALLEELENKYN